MLPVLTCRWLCQSGYNEELTKGALSCLHCLCSHGHSLDRIAEDQFRTLNTQLLSWLLHASRNSLTTPSSGISLFSLSGANKKQVRDNIILFIMSICTICRLYGTYMSVSIYPKSAQYVSRGLWIFLAEISVSWNMHKHYLMMIDLLCSLVATSEGDWWVSLSRHIHCIKHWYVNVTGM